MANTVLAFDIDDAQLGTFFRACRNNLEIYFKNHWVNPIHLNSPQLNETALGFTIDSFESFVFGAYCHGDHDCLLRNATHPYISMTLNGNSFGNSFFYTWSCRAGSRLGKELVENGCRCFIGYKNTIHVWTHKLPIFAESATHGLISFFDGNDTLSVLNHMKEKYNELIDSLYTTDFLTAATLRENRDSLVLHGQNISVSTFTSK